MRPSLRLCLLVISSVLLLAACAMRTTPTPASAQKSTNGIDATPEAARLSLTLKDPTKLRLIVIGDTGAPGEVIGKWRKSIRAERKDAVLVTGDLLYPEAPLCPSGRLTEAGRTMIDAHLGDILSGLGAPTYLLLGNHDVSHDRYEARRERCVLNYIAGFDDLILPATNYTVDFGIALLGIVDTNKLDDGAAAVISEGYAGHSGAKLLAGHHTLKTYHDKEKQDIVRPWIGEHGIKPHMYLNGHAHLLQFGVYDSIPALTSGTGRYPRERPICPGHCGPGQLWGVSDPGYAVLEVTQGAAGTHRLSVEFKDADGRSLWTWDNGIATVAP
ncbi:MAG: hypothetical protein ACI9MR_001768 [Myxococcota bacterium]|jgi:hypothetical protein